MKYAIFKKTDKDVSGVVNNLIKECAHHELSFDEDNPDIVFVLGGDGTFLKAVHHYLNKLDKVVFAGVRCGTLGFFYSYDPDDVSLLVELVAAKLYSEESHRLIECDLGENIIFAVNEIRFENPFHTLVCSVSVNDEQLEKFHGNGLLVCSELGSTAYNKSLGGAVIHRDLDVLQLTEISTIQNNLYRSLGSSFIVPSDTVFTFEGDFTNVVIGYDHLTCKCDGLNTFKVRSSDRCVRIITNKNHNPLSAIKRSFIK